MGILNKILAVIVAATLGLGAYTYKTLFYDAEPQKQNVDKLALKKNILVLGVDKRDGDVGRSDTMFVVMLDPKNEHMSLLSIPRDTMVRIPGNGWNKINHAYAYGGHKLSEQTVENFLGIKINNYVLIDIKGFVGLVDALGGIDIDVEKNMTYSDPYDDGTEGLVIHLVKGRQHLSGQHAMEYVRYRDEEGDIGRIKRQQKFIKAVYEKAMQPETLLKLPAIISSISKMITTDVPVQDMLSVLKAMKGGSQVMGDLKMAMVPGHPADIEEINYWIPDMVALRSEMVAMQGASMSNNFSQAAQASKGEYDRLLGMGDTDKSKGKQVIKNPKSKELQEAIEKARKANAQDRASKKALRQNTSNNQVNGEDNGPEANVQSQPQRISQVRVQVINCTGSPAALNKAIGQIGNAGISVVGTGNGAKRASTLIVATTDNGSAIGKFSALSFRYALRRDTSAANGVEGIIYLGQDYL